MKNFLSKIFQTVTEAFKNCLKRFPVTVCFIFALTAYAIYQTAREYSPSPLFFTIGYYLSVGTVLSLSLHLWTEEMKRPATKIAVHLIGHIALLADAIFLYSIDIENPTPEIFAAHIAGLLAVGLSTFFLSFLREKNDIPSWNFTLQSIYTFAVTFFIGGVMCGGICLLITSLNALFNIQFSDRWYAYTAIATTVWLPLMLFIGLLPKGKEKHNHTPQSNGFLNGIMHYLFIPLTIAYLVVLYVYAAQILVRWELPNGWVSKLVVAIMAICLILESGLYPSRVKDGKKWDLLVARWLPILILPLLILMTVGIARRLNDYGVTVNRLYLITLNGWMYFVCIGLFFSKGKRINWIPISFALIFLLTSVFPLNITSYTRRKIYNEIEAQVKASYNGNLPMDDHAYENWLTQLPKEQGLQINARMRYLHSYFGDDSYASIATKDISTTLYSFDIEIDTTAAGQQNLDMNFFCKVSRVEIPQGFSKVYHIDNEEKTYPVSEFTSDSIAFQLILNNEDINETIRFDLETLKKLYAKGGQTPMEFPCKTKEYRFFLSGFRSNTTYNGQVRLFISGLLFRK